jgi:UDP-N-acetylmuramyl pentapeptide phosphotransferase/UDP-N-acetylglucosamine-1-phosphate transferase
MGGIAIYAAFVIAILSNVIFSKELFSVIIAASIVFISGLLDDIMKLSSRIRLLLQMLAVGILLMNGITISIFEPTWFGVRDNIEFNDYLPVDNRIDQHHKLL